MWSRLRFPPSEIPLVSSNGREKFILDLRKSRVDLSKGTYQNRGREGSWFLCGSITAAPLIATLMEVKSGRPTSIVTEKDMLISGQSLSRKFSPRTAETTSGLKTSWTQHRPAAHHSEKPLLMIKEVRMLLNSYYRWLRKQTALRELKDWIEITTPYLDRHNDCLQIYVRRVNGGFELTDDGHIIEDLEQSGCNIDSISVGLCSKRLSTASA